MKIQKISDIIRLSIILITTILVIYGGFTKGWIHENYTTSIFFVALIFILYLMQQYEIDKINLKLKEKEREYE